MEGRYVVVDEGDFRGSLTFKSSVIGSNGRASIVNNSRKGMS